MIADFLRQTAQLLSQLDQAAIAQARDLLLDAYRRQGRVFTAGNGGSASTAQHFACDLAKYVIPPGARPFDVRSLTDNVSLYTAWANDAAREDVFANLMRGLLRPEDVVILISVHGGAGFSGDLVRALRYANEVGARTISLVGFDGGTLHRRVDLLDPRARRVHAPNGSHPSGHRALAHAPAEGRVGPGSRPVAALGRQLNCRPNQGHSPRRTCRPGHQPPFLTAFCLTRGCLLMKMAVRAVPRVSFQEANDAECK